MGRTGLLVDLDGGLVGVDSNDLSNEVVVAHTDLLLSMSGCAKSH
jgi:predicted HAD superfamily phosphohydrolase YqeG